MDFGGGRADRISAAVFFVIGGAMAYGGFVMDRLEIRQIHPASIPGLLPMVLGAALMICAAALYASSERGEERVAVGAHSNMDLLFAAVWRRCLRRRVCWPYAVCGGDGHLHRGVRWLVHDPRTRARANPSGLYRGVRHRGGGRGFRALQIRLSRQASMMEALAAFLVALSAFLTPVMIGHVVWSTLLGIFVGSLPGLTATMGVALLTTLTYTFERDTAILILICMYVGAIYGGSRSAILLNIPGTPASAATALDGYPLAQQGKAAYAMSLATAGSALGTIVGILLLVLLAPPLAEVALNFGSFEFFWLAVFGVVISGQLTGGASPLKGYIAGLLGLMVAMIGSDGIHAHIRFNFGFQDLNGGTGLIPAMVGAFGFAEVLTVMWRNKAKLVERGAASARALPRFVDLWRYKFTIARSGVIGNARRHHSWCRGGHRRLGVLCGGPTDQRRARPLWEGLDRGSYGGGNRKQRGCSRRFDPGLDACGSGLRAGGGPDRRAVYSWRAARSDDHDRGTGIHLFGRCDAGDGHRGCPGVRSWIDPGFRHGPESSKRILDARRLHIVRHRTLRADAAGIRYLGDGRLRTGRVPAAADELPHGPAGSRHHPR